MRREDRNWLTFIREKTDHPVGRYPGLEQDRLPDDVRERLGKLINRLHPNNPRHKVRVLITEAGRAALDGDKEIAP